MEADVRKNKQHIQGQKETIRCIGEIIRQCVTKMVQLFHPEGEVQMKARLYDEKVGQPGLEGAARMKNVVWEYSDKVKAFLVEFRALAEHMTRESPFALKPDEEEATNWGERVGSEDGLQGVFRMSAEAPQAGEIDRLMRMGSSKQKHTSRPVMDTEPIDMADPESEPRGGLGPGGRHGGDGCPTRHRRKA